MKIRIVPLLLCGLAMIATSRGQQKPIVPGGIILVAEANGYVGLQSISDREPRRAAVDEKVDEGAAVSTEKVPGSSAILAVSNGAIISLAADSLLRVDRLAQTPFEGTVKVDDVQREPSSSDTQITLVRGAIVGKVPALRSERGSAFIVAIDGRRIDVGASVFRIVRSSTGELRIVIFPRKFTDEDEQMMRALVDEVRKTG